MQINTESIKNKQRILIGGNEGASEIFELVKKILNHINKPVDFLLLGSEFTPSDAPVVIIKEDEKQKCDEALLQNLNIHILLVHKVTESKSTDFKNFERCVDQLEKLADGLPKAGSFIYFEEDDVATMIGKKERTDVKNIEYSRLKSKTTSGGMELISDNHRAVLKNKDVEFSAYAGAAKVLLQRIGIIDEQFFSALEKL